MKFKIEWMEKKSPEWFVANLTDESGNETKEVSINKVNKKGEVFPNFDDLMTGGTVEGEPWTSGVGKNYLFAPKPEGAKRPNMDRIMDKKTQSIEVAQERKNINIEKAQDRSAWMWAKTNASTLLAGRGVSPNTPIDGIADMVLDLATKIYHGEPTNPF